MRLSLSGLGEPKKTINKYQLKYNCPFCDDTHYHLGVHTKKGIYHCFKCNVSGKLQDLAIPLTSFEDRVKQMLGSQASEEHVISLPASPRIGSVALPFEAKPVSLQSGLPYKYLKNRRVTEEEIIKYNLHYCSEGNFHDRIIVPIYEGEELVYFLGRAYRNLVPKYLNAPVPKENIVFKTFTGKVKVAIICEGVFDAFRVAKVKPAIALLGKVATQHQIQNIVNSVTEKVLVLLDDDAKQEGYILANRIGLYRKTKWILPWSKDPGSTDTTELERRIG